MPRLFFALWPGEEAARRLSGLALEIAGRGGGKPVPMEKIHLTLAFLGEVPPERIEAARAAGDATGGKGFELAFDCVGSFRAAQVAWAGQRETSAALAGLQSRLAAALAARGFALEDRPYTPHLTLARRTARTVPREAIVPVRWKVEAFRLVRSEPGTGSYTILAEWPLGPARRS